MSTRLEVIVGNIGTVYDGKSITEAMRIYLVYVNQSKSDRGRAGGEDVVLYRDGEPIKEFQGRQSWLECASESTDLPEIDEFPEQGEFYNRTVEVYLNTKADRKVIMGQVVRDDKDNPQNRIIRLYDGRLLLDKECIFRLV